MVSVSVVAGVVQLLADRNDELLVRLAGEARTDKLTWPAAGPARVRRARVAGAGARQARERLDRRRGDVIDEARILVREAVVILLPHVRGEQVVE